MHYLPPPEFGPRPIPFRWIFPLGQLCVCVLLVGSVTTTPVYRLGIHRSAVLEGVAALNLPAGVIQIPIEASREDKQELKPTGIDLFLWRAITWPLIGLLFWWIAGRAVEALVSSGNGQLTPRISWIEVISGFLVMTAGGLVVLAMLSALFSGK